MRSSITSLLSLILVTVCLLAGCGSLRPVTQLVLDTQRDTVYLSNIQYDSIYIYQDRLLDRSKDTVYLKDVSVEYRYKLLRDTVRVIQRDSIPYEVTIVETKEITRPLTWFDHLTRACFWLLIGVIFVFFVRAVYPELCRRVFKNKFRVL